LADNDIRGSRILKKIFTAALILLAVASLVVFAWARSVFGEDAVRTALAAQLSKSLGQPVNIGRIGVTIYPRLTVNLGAVKVGTPARIQIETLQIGTDLRALLSRRIEHGVIRLIGAHVELPLPAFATGSSGPVGSDGPRRAPVELVSVDGIVLRDVNITSGGRSVLQPPAAIRSTFRGMASGC
jgi:hypothetical protein